MIFPSCRRYDAVEDSHPPRQHNHIGKIRGSTLPQEYDLSRLLQNFEILHPSWNTLTPACEWQGITCGSDFPHLCVSNSQVTQIYWNEMSLRGSLQWDYLPLSVHSFHIGNNWITGSVPFHTLPSHFTCLQLLNNQFTGPVDFVRLPQSLRNLCLNSNLFYGEADLTHLPPGLVSLQFSSNKFSGTLDLCSLPHGLALLELRDNALSGPLDLRQLPSSLVTLNCEANRFCGLVQFDKLPKQLLSVYLSENTELCGKVDTYPSSGFPFVSVKNTNIRETFRNATFEFF